MLEILLRGPFGSGIIEAGMLMDTAGTASVLCCASDEYHPDTEFETLVQMPSPVEDLWHPLAYINGGGLCIRWFRDEFTGKPAASYDELMAEAKTFLPEAKGYYLFLISAGAFCLTILM